MKLGAGPDDSADYWEERKNIDYKIKTLTNAKDQLGDVDGEMKKIENKIVVVLESTKQPD